MVFFFINFCGFFRIKRGNDGFSSVNLTNLAKFLWEIRHIFDITRLREKKALAISNNLRKKSRSGKNKNK